MAQRGHSAGETAATRALTVALMSEVGIAAAAMVVEGEAVTSGPSKLRSGRSVWFPDDVGEQVWVRGTFVVLHHPIQLLDQRSTSSPRWASEVSWLRESEMAPRPAGERNGPTNIRRSFSAAVPPPRWINQRVAFEGGRFSS